MGGGDEDDAPCNIRILSFLGAFSDEAPAGTPLVLLCCAAILQLSFLFLSLSFYSNVNIRGATRTEAEKAVTIVAMPDGAFADGCGEAVDLLGVVGMVGARWGLIGRLALISRRPTSMLWI